MATIPHYDFLLDVGQLEGGAVEIIRRVKPLWDVQRLKFHHFTEGLCNVLVGCFQPDDKNNMVLVRAFGENSDIFVDRNAEKEMVIFLSMNGFAPPLYCTFNNGMAYGFVKGEPLDEKMVKDKNVRSLIAKEMAKLHSLRMDQHSRGDNPGPEPLLLTKMENWLTSAPEQFSNEEKQKLFTRELKSKSYLRQEFEMLKKHLENMSCEIVVCHNDLLCQNIIFDSEQNKIGFIDYEFAFYNYNAFDIGNHFNEYAGMTTQPDYSKYPDRDYQLSWIRTYLVEYFKLTGKKVPPSDSDVEKLYVQANQCAIVSHFFWGLCNLIQCQISAIDFDYLGYGVSRFREYFNRRNEFLSLSEH